MLFAVYVLAILRRLALDSGPAHLFLPFFFPFFFFFLGLGFTIRNSP